MLQLVLQLVLMLVLQLVEQLAELLCISPFPSIKTEHKTLYDHTEIIKPCITGLISSVLARMVVGMVATKQTLCRELTSDTVLMRAELKADEKWTDFSFSFGFALVRVDLITYLVFRPQLPCRPLHLHHVAP